jgi:hypothetical protein
MYCYLITILSRLVVDFEGMIINEMIRFLYLMLVYSYLNIIPGALREGIHNVKSD